MEIALDPGITVLFGENAQGKTNLLEAVYVLGALRSFRAARTEELVAHGASEARLEATAERSGLRSRLEVVLRAGGRQARVDGKLARSVQAWFGALSVVLFAPEHLALVRGSPALRRQLLDRATFALDPGHLAVLLDYQRTLRSRNAVLRDRPRDAEALLDVYDDRLASLGARLVEGRIRTLGELAPHAADAWRGFEAAAELSLSYRSGETTREALREAFAASRARDLARRLTSAGPHTDDLAISLAGRAAAQFASQGQARAVVLALKIAEIRRLTGRLGDAPVLLLDDVSSELDRIRSRQLFEHVGAVGCQTLVTTTRPEQLELPEKPSIFQVVAGTVVRSVFVAGKGSA